MKRQVVVKNTKINDFASPNPEPQQIPKSTNRVGLPTQILQGASIAGIVK